MMRPLPTRAWPLCMSRCVLHGFRPMLLLLRAVLGLLEQLPGAEPAGVQVTAKSTCSLQVAKPVEVQDAEQVKLSISEDTIMR